MSGSRWRRLLRPLDPLRSIKVKLGVVIVGSVIASLWAVVFGWTTGVRPRWLVATTGITARWSSSCSPTG